MNINELKITSNALKNLPLSQEYNFVIEKMIEYYKNLTTSNNIEISTNDFVSFCLIEPDSMLYKSVNSFLNTQTINEIYSELNNNDNKINCLSVIRPIVKIFFSKKLTEYLNDCLEIIKSCNHDKICTDHILLAILKDNNDNKIKPVFEKRGLTYDNFLNSVNRTHENNNFDLENIDESYIGDDWIQNLPEALSLNNILNGAMMLPENIDLTSILTNQSKPKKEKEKDKKNKTKQVQFCTNLNEQAQNGLIDDLIGREKEIHTIEKIFARRKSNNVIIVGKNGCGKSAIIEGLAKRIVNRTAPVSLHDRTIYSLNINKLIAGTSLRGMFEDRLAKMFSELESIEKPILFIDDIHNICTEKKKDEYDIIGNIGQYIKKNNIQIVFSTTPSGYKTITSSNPSIISSFHRVDIDSPTINETNNIINGLKQAYENYHNVVYSDEAIDVCVKLSERYITNVSLPSSAIDILDEAGAAKKVSLLNNRDLETTKNLLDDLEFLKSCMIKNDKVDDIDNINNEITNLKVRINEITEEINNAPIEERTVTVDDIYTAISEHTNIPVSKISISEKKNLLKINELLKENVIGQDEAIDDICNAIKRNKVGLHPTNRPIYSAMLIGNSGVGKTLIAKKLASEIFGDEKYLVRFDMSEYADEASVNKVIGSSAGYIGYDKGGLLTEAIKNKKYCVLLIDEIEKAHDKIYNLFLQILDDGFLTDNMGEKVDFKNTIILLTSNVGVKQASNTNIIGFNTDLNKDKKEIIQKELKKKFPPEFINRLDDVVYFNDLKENDLKQIIHLEMNKLQKRLNEINVTISYNDNLVNKLYDLIKNDSKYGARPIIRIIQKEIENRISDYLLLSDSKIVTHHLDFDVFDGDIIIR